MLFLDGVYVDGAGSTIRFHWVKAPMDDELAQLAHTIAYRIARFLERQGLLEPDESIAGAFDYLSHRRGIPAGPQGIYIANPACLRCRRSVCRYRG
jgi:hypothetical protein